MSKYNNAKVYEIICNISGKRYIGSTCETLLCRRLAGHVSMYKKWQKKLGLYYSSFQILEKNDYYINLLEKVNCLIKDELLSRERHYINTLECVNKNIPLRTSKEYYQDNITTIKNYK